MSKRTDAIAVLKELGYKQVGRGTKPAVFRKLIKGTAIEQHVAPDGKLTLYTEAPNGVMRKHAR